ncbi:MAG: DUF1149 family protein [Bombilactobacillus mellifer]|nr:DUF1149 family protein [Bombilactobacillus mellifer]
MHLKRQPIFVQAFHYDLSQRKSSQTSGIGVQLHKLNLEEIKKNISVKVPETDSVIEVIVPFDFVPPQQNFAISGLMKQLVWIEGFSGIESELPSEAIKKLSRPIIELIETLTYEVTTLVLDHGVNLNFIAKAGKSENTDSL